MYQSENSKEKKKGELKETHRLFFFIVLHRQLCQSGMCSTIVETLFEIVFVGFALQHFSCSASTLAPVQTGM